MKEMVGHLLGNYSLSIVRAIIILCELIHSHVTLSISDVEMCLTFVDICLNELDLNIITIPLNIDKRKKEKSDWSFPGAG